MKKFKWEVNKLSRKSHARIGTITTPHGIVKTPAFIFCGTKASLKNYSTTEAKKNNTDGRIDIK